MIIQHWRMAGTARWWQELHFSESARTDRGIHVPHHLKTAHVELILRMLKWLAALLDGVKFFQNSFYSTDLGAYEEIDQIHTIWPAFNWCVFLSFLEKHRLSYGFLKKCSKTHQWHNSCNEQCFLPQNAIGFISSSIRHVSEQYILPYHVNSRALRFSGIEPAVESKGF